LQGFFLLFSDSAWCRSRLMSHDLAHNLFCSTAGF